MDSLLAIFRIFPNSSWADSGYRAFKQCAFIVIFTVCFHFYICKNFKNEDNSLKLIVDKLCDKLPSFMSSSIVAVD